QRNSRRTRRPALSLSNIAERIYDALSHSHLRLALDARARLPRRDDALNKSRQRTNRFREKLHSRHHARARLTPARDRRASARRRIRPAAHTQVRAGTLARERDTKRHATTHSAAPPARPSPTSQNRAPGD